MYVAALLVAFGCTSSASVSAPASKYGAHLVDAWLTTGDATKSLSHEPTDTLETQLVSKRFPVITVDETTKYQQMIGFGGAFTDASTYLIETKLPPSRRDSLMRELFSRGSGGLGLSFMRIPMGASDFSFSWYTYDDMPDGETDPTLAHFSIAMDQAYKLPIIKQALSINPQLTLLANPWSPPAWMKTSDSLVQGTLNPSAYTSFANYFVKFIRAYEAQGVPISAITLQNEPHSTADNLPTMVLDPPTRALLVGHYVGPLFARSGLTTAIWEYDHNWYFPTQPLSVLDDDVAAKYIQAVAWHCYAGNPSAQSTVHWAYPAKDTYVSECSGGDFVGDYSANLNFFVGQLVIGATQNWARGVALWNLALDENDGPRTEGCDNCHGLVTIDDNTGAITRNPEYYALAQVSTFVRPGAYRIASTWSIGSLTSVAFQNTDDQSIVALVLNSAAQSSRFTLQWRQQSLQYTLPPVSVVTFIWK